MDHVGHKKYLEYRERHSYFGAQRRALSREEFAEADAAWSELARAGSSRDDEDEVRYAELSALLHRD